MQAIPDLTATKPEEKPMMQSAVARASERRTVAVLFCDVCGFTAMSEKLDPEEVSNIIQPLFQLCNNAINKFGGVIEKFIGDALMAIFGVPISHEDDAERAALAALEMRDIIQRFGADLEQRMGFSVNMRIGLNVGTIVAGSVDSGEGKNYQVLGDAINTAARMEQNAKPGNILVTEQMYRLLRDSFELQKGVQIQAKGKAEPLQAYDLLGIRRLKQGRRGFEQRRVPFVGRVEEVSGIKARGQNILEHPQADFVLISGDSGLGKTRLVTEVFQRLRENTPDLRLLQGNSTSYSKNFSYFLLQNLIRSLLGIDERQLHDDVQLLIRGFLKDISAPNASMLANLLEYILYPHIEIPQFKFLEPERLQQQIFKGISDVLLCLAGQVPLFIQLDDLQWCDPLSLQWLASFQQLALHKQLPIFVCVTARSSSEQGESAPENQLKWQLHLSLDPLPQHHCRNLIEHILDVPSLPPALQGLFDAILLRASGNPYYIEEVLKNLFDDGLLIQNASQEWELTCQLRDLPLPGSVQRLIMTRFDRLPEKQRQTLQTLSAVGNAAPWSLVQHLLGVEGGFLQTEVQALTDTQFVRIENGQRGTELVFQQALTQEVIYNTMVNRRKRLLHQQIAEALEVLHQSDPSQILDLLAFHFSRTPEARKAVRYLYLAAEQAGRHYANAQALEQYTQILELLGQIEAQTLISVDFSNKEWLRVVQLRQMVIQRQCEIQLLTGAYEEVLTLANASLSGELGPIEKARLLYCKGRVLEKRSDFASARTLYEEARTLMASQSDLLGQARMWNAIGWVSRWLNEYDQALEACQQALELLEKHPDMEQIAYAHNVIGVAAFYRHDWDLALSHYRQSLEIQEQIHDLWGRANSLSNLGNVYFMINHWDEAIRVFQESLQIREQLGDLEGISHSCNNLGHAYQELGRLEEAGQALKQALTLYTQLENTLGVAVAQCNLGTIRFRQQDWQAALELLNAGIATLQQRNMAAMLSEALNHRIQIHLECGELAPARQYLGSDSESIRSHGDPVQQGRLERLWGKFHYLNDDLAAAGRSLQFSLELLQNANHPGECQLLYADLAELHRSQGSAEADYWEEMCTQNSASSQLEKSLAEQSPG